MHTRDVPDNDIFSMDHLNHNFAWLPSPDYYEDNGWGWFLINKVTHVDESKYLAKY